MDTEDLDPIDILAFTTQELQERYRNAKDDPVALANVFDDFLQRWYADPAMDVLRKMKIEFEKDLDWFNVTQPLTMEALRGKVVILDFFTYCCINCMHVLPELHALEGMFPVERGLVVVGVHSPKFENEKDGANILSAAQRYGITHPIVNDPRSVMWRSVGIRCWPSLLVLSPKGEPLMLLMGEGHGTFLQGFLPRALKYFQHDGGIASFALPLRPSTDLLPASNLRFPAKIARSPTGDFAIADAGNNRILIFNLEGLVLYKIGGNSAGLMDGNFTQARFNSPQGVTFLNANVLIVADTENHALRQITLSPERVETLAGTGKQGSDRVGGQVGPLQEIASPWDVAVFHTRDMDMSFHLDERNVPEKPIILVAMSGTHQIWGYFPEGIIWWKFRKFEPRICVSLIGNGQEENRNNSYPQNAAFAQPSGLAMAQNALFIADSESSSIRKVSMVDGKVTAVVGGDRNPLNLFAFGDVDGKQYNAKLQHPLGVAYNHVSEMIYVADTYNHKIKVIDPAANAITTLSITKEDGAAQHQFNEPAGLCFDASGDQLLVADTNNHCIQMVDVKSLKAKQFHLNFVQTHQSETDSGVATALRGGLQLMKSLPLRGYQQLNLSVAITLDDSLKFTAEAPQKWSVKAINSTLQASSQAGTVQNGKFMLQLRRSNVDSKPRAKEDIKLEISLGLCDAKSCLMKRFSVVINDDAATSGGLDPTANGLADEVINLHITQADVKLK